MTVNLEQLARDMAALPPSQKRLLAEMATALGDRGLAESLRMAAAKEEVEMVFSVVPAKVIRVA